MNWVVRLLVHAAMRKTLGRSTSVVFILAILAAAFGFTSAKNVVGGSRHQIETAASVLEVRPYTRSPKPRLWVRYEFLAKSGNRVQSKKAIYVPKWDSIETGDAITVRYNPKRPRSSSRITAFTAPAQDQVASKPAPVKSMGSWVLTFIFGAIAVLAGFAFITHLLGPLAQILAKASGGKDGQGKPDDRASSRARRLSSRMARYKGWKPAASGSRFPGRGPRSTVKPKSTGRTKTDSWGRAPRKSKVKQRAGWF